MLHVMMTALVAGRHRLAAALRLGWEQIDCLFVDMDEIGREIQDNIFNFVHHREPGSYGLITVTKGPIDRRGEQT
jgi:hypothetical protein